jgi:hypothetical protein
LIIAEREQARNEVQRFKSSKVQEFKSLRNDDEEGFNVVPFSLSVDTGYDTGKI